MIQKYCKLQMNNYSTTKKIPKMPLSELMGIDRRAQERCLWWYKMVSYSKAPNHVKQDLKSESKTHNIWKGYVYLESSVIKLLAILLLPWPECFTSGTFITWYLNMKRVNCISLITLTKHYIWHLMPFALPYHLWTSISIKPEILM